MEDVFVESFHGIFKDECLNLHRFKILRNARETIETKRFEYITPRGRTDLLMILLLQYMMKRG